MCTGRIPRTATPLIRSSATRRGAMPALSAGAELHSSRRVTESGIGRRAWPTLWVLGRYHRGCIKDGKEGGNKYGTEPEHQRAEGNDQELRCGDLPTSSAMASRPVNLSSSNQGTRINNR